MAATVFIAEDDEEVGELLQVIFERGGFSPVLVRDGSSLIERLRADKPAVLILDVMLPGVDGHELMMQLSQDAALCTIPVIVLTALSSAQSMFEKFPQVKAYMVKPFDPPALLARVKELLA